jgi:hypothetical protein
MTDDNEPLFLVVHPCHLEDDESIAMLRGQEQLGLQVWVMPRLGQPGVRLEEWLRVSSH